MQVGLALPTMASGWSRATFVDWCRLIDGGPFSSISCGERITFHPVTTVEKTGTRTGKLCQFLLKSGAGDFIVRVAQSVAGRYQGGAGHVAVVGSGLMGSVSGSAVATTVSTGVITIPMMTR